MAQALAERARWRRDYNTVSPHSRLGGKTTAEIAGHVAVSSNNQHDGTRLDV
jgi:putative transposase